MGSALDVYHPEFTTPEETRTGQHTGDSVVRGLACFCLSSHPCTHPCLSLGIRWAIVLEEGQNTEDCSRSRGPGMLWELKMGTHNCAAMSPSAFSSLLFVRSCCFRITLGCHSRGTNKSGYLKRRKFFFSCLPWLPLNE